MTKQRDEVCPGPGGGLPTSCVAGRILRGQLKETLVHRSGRDGCIRLSLLNIWPPSFLPTLIGTYLLLNLLSIRKDDIGPEVNYYLGKLEYCTCDTWSKVSIFTKFIKFPIFLNLSFYYSGYIILIIWPVVSWPMSPLKDKVGFWNKIKIIILIYKIQMRHLRVGKKLTHHCIVKHVNYSIFPQFSCVFFS